MSSTLEQDCRDTLGGLKAAMIDLYASVGADPSRPQDTSRRLRLNKTLTWNLARLMQAPSGIEAIPHLPGTASIEKLLEATERKGASRQVIERVRAAARRCEEMIETHAGDRATLDLIIDGLAGRNGRALEVSRKHAFLGNSGIYGAQARTRLMSCLLAPNAAEPDQLDMVMLSGYAGLRRLRPQVRLPIFRIRQWSGEGQQVGSAGGWEPLEPGSAGGLLGDFTSAEAPEIEAVRADGGVDYILQPGQVGNRGAIDVYQAEALRAGASRWRIGSDTTGEFGLTLMVPAETLIIDLVAHEDVAYALHTRTIVRAHTFTQQGLGEESTILPINQPAVELPGSPPAVATPLVPRYVEMEQRMFERMGWDAADFRAVRLDMKYPPLGATIVLQFDLPESPRR
ncbi:MAG: hypothetical protein ACF8R7_06460 [Phycisphaerales bacterium JB039]